MVKLPSSSCSSPCASRCRPPVARRPPGPPLSLSCRVEGDKKTTGPLLCSLTPHSLAPSLSAPLPDPKPSRLAELAAEQRRRYRAPRADRSAPPSPPRLPLPLRARNRAGAPPFARSPPSSSSPAVAFRASSSPFPSTSAPTERTYASRVSTRFSWTPLFIPARRSSSCPS